MHYLAIPFCDPSLPAYCAVCAHVRMSHDTFQTATTRNCVLAVTGFIFVNFNSNTFIFIHFAYKRFFAIWLEDPFVAYSLHDEHKVLFVFLWQMQRMRLWLHHLLLWHGADHHHRHFIVTFSSCPMQAEVEREKKNTNTKTMKNVQRVCALAVITCCIF